MKDENTSQAQPAKRIDVDRILADDNADRNQLRAAISQCTSDLADIDNKIDLLRRDRREQSIRALKGCIRADIDDLKDSRRVLAQKRSTLVRLLDGDVEDHDHDRATREGEDALWVEKHARGFLSTLRNIPSQIQDKAENAKSASTRETNAAHLQELLRIRDKVSDPAAQASAAADFLQGYRRVLYAKISGIEESKATFIAAFLDAVRSLKGDRDA